MRSKVWRPAAPARNRAPGGPGHRPPGTIRPGCEELAARVAEEMPQTEARPPAENRHGGAPRGERTDRKVRVAPAGATQEANAPGGAPPTPRRSDSISRPGGHRAAGMNTAV